MDLKTGYLFLASLTVAVVALLYGVNPEWFVRTLLNSAEPAIDLSHILRAVMGLYLALGAFWLFCAVTGRHRSLAILTTLIFAGGLFAGRLLSIAIDGLPAPLLTFYTLLELAILPVAWWLYRKPD